MQHLMLWLMFLGSAFGAEPDVAAWTHRNIISLDIASSSLNSVWWEYTIHGDGDLEIRSTADDSEIEIALVAGRYMLVRGTSLKPGYEIDAIDGPVLMLQLLVQLLSRAFPNGPASVSQQEAIEVRNIMEPIYLSTPGAEAGFPAPWGMSGFISRGSNSFVLDLAFEPSGYADPLLITATVKTNAASQSMDGAYSLEGWVVYSLGPMEIKTPQGTIFDYGATLIQSPPPTIGELRVLAGESR